MAAKEVVALVAAVVAPRKTVMYEGKYVGPGTQVRLREVDVLELRALGFLLDPDAAAAPPVADGPTFETEGGGATVTPA